MKKKSCPLEKEVLNSLKTGDLTPGIKQHAADCPVCKESITINKWMNRFQEVSMNVNTAGKKLPDAEFIWEKAFLVKPPEKELVKKALRPLLVPQVLTYVIAIIGLLYFFLSPDAAAMFTSLSPMLNVFFKSFSFLLLPMTAGLLSVIVFIFVTGFEPKKTRSL